MPASQPSSQIRSATLCDMPGPSPRPPRAGPRRARAALEAGVLAVVVGGIALVTLTLLQPSSPATAAGTAATGSGALRWTLHGAPAPALDLPDQNGRKTTIAALLASLGDGAVVKRFVRVKIGED